MKSERSVLLFDFDSFCRLGSAAPLLPPPETLGSTKSMVSGAGRFLVDFSAGTGTFASSESCDWDAAEAARRFFFFFADFEEDEAEEPADEDDIRGGKGCFKSFSDSLSLEGCGFEDADDGCLGGF